MSMSEFPKPDPDIPDLEMTPSPPERPFQVVVRSTDPNEPATTSHAEFDEGDSELAGEVQEEFSLDEIEAAYMRALEAADYVETLSSGILEAESPKSGESAQDVVAEEIADEVTSSIETSEADAQEGLSQTGSESTPFAEGLDVSAEATSQPVVESTAELLTNDDEPIISVEQVVEALLFVGGAPLPVRKFQDVLGGAQTPEQVETMIESLNARYRMQRRPYQVGLVEGGYQLQLLNEFESIRGRAYGHGPKEVKLAQDALEVLAYIAYRQPVSRDGLQEIEKPNASALVRQLLRRQLVYIDRSDPEVGEQYRTTGRFLEVFGLTSLEDLPQAGTFNFR